MNAHEELVRRLALKRSRKLGSLSKEAFAELEFAVRNDPSSFIDDDEEQAFSIVDKALYVYSDSMHDDDLLDDAQYMEERTSRMARLSNSCQKALSIDPNCTDASLLFTLATVSSADEAMFALSNLNDRTKEKSSAPEAGATGDAWLDVFARPHLRMLAALSRMALGTARFSLTRSYCEDLLTRAPIDALGARFTYALALARMEDEDGFDWLDAREGRKGNAWFHLSRAILMYKLGRMPAARRALNGYGHLCTGGAYALLQPIFIETYMPDRPSFEPGSFTESMLTVHEAEPIIADIPDFIGWASSQTEFYESAITYCNNNGFEWRNPGTF